MLVVHGAWVDGRLGVWAEDTARAPLPASRAALRRHPFAAPAATLMAALNGAATREAGPAGPFTGVMARAEDRELTIRLPGSATGPLPSPESGLTSRARSPKISTWLVPALLFSPVDVLSLLGPLSDPSSGSSDIGAGPSGVDSVSGSSGSETGRGGAVEPDRGPEWGPGLSLRYFAVVAEQARGLVRRGRILPQLVVENGEHSARWRPVLTGADLAMLLDLAAAMPPVCRAVPGERPSSDVLREALNGLADGAARLSLPDRLILSSRPGLKTALPDRWLYALTGEDASLPGARPAEAVALGDALAGWFASAHELDGPVRACFELIEPAGDGESWRVEFGLAPAGDPAGYLSADQIRAGQRAPWLPERPEELLRTDLNRAVRLHPDLYTALRTPEPSGLKVETAWAFSFLRNGAPMLRAAGYGVRLPAWAGRQGLGLKLTTRAVAGDEAFGLERRVSFRLDVAIGDHTISGEELAELARLRIPLVQVKGQWVELDDQQLKAALKIVEERGDGERTVSEVIREVVEGGEEELPLVAVDADGLLGDLLSGEADRRLAPVAVPRALMGTLRPYQERGLSWLSFLSGLGLGGILADDMGLGKTISTLSLLLSERESGPHSPTLLVCPMSLIGNWQKEAARFAPSLRVYVHHGATRRREEELAAAVREADLVVTTYGTTLRDLGALAALEWGRVVCDEAQAIKNSSAQQSRAVRSIPARTRLALTGTPVENHLSELWSIMEFCNPGLLGPAKRFRRRYQDPIETPMTQRDTAATATAALKRATGPFVLRRLKTDKTIISDLPEKLEMKVWCTLTEEQAKLYKAVVNDMLGRIDGSAGIERRGNVLATMTRLKQVCNHPAHLLKDGSRLAGRSGKLARLEELAEEILDEGDKALVFTQYTEFGSLLQPYLAAHLDRPVLWLHGGLPKKQRDALVERFQDDDEPMLFLLSLKAAGTGLNLTAANHVIHVDRWWNPAVENQATDRAFRIGQTKNVQVRKFICLDTLEERIDEMIERKKTLAESVVGTGEDWITNLSTDQLRELFQLGPGAVS
ncbi:Superfamily II DNA or RNA helicase, SNF2 family [Streptosporangium subroseum]|uniref:Superfamily II DNA or RNA helicase, SNF2 family n=1 Tax=Streptosporangium subroseum TaxID=106412 RepID=A0A239C706_9ACTN|nr:DEAD/DEAH box helicase [Streptosporangium subroseum]SNS15682.1 Superfamily II DNA or RNA helicase, SNF2 family [Streptosporangium subroseum]